MTKTNYLTFESILVSHAVFMKKQPFLEFLCEVMLRSPSGKLTYGQQRDVVKAEGDDVLQFLDVNSQYYQDEAAFLLKQCKGKFVPLFLNNVQRLL